MAALPLQPSDANEGFRLCIGSVNSQSEEVDPILSVLQALVESPLRVYFAQLFEVNLCFNVGQGVMQLVSSLFPGVENLCVDDGYEFDDSLIDTVLDSRSLEVLHLHSLHSIITSQSIIPALLCAAHAGMSFQLLLYPSPEDAERQQELENVSDEWDTLVERIGGPMEDVQLFVIT